MSAHILEVNDLHYYYGSIHALKGISFYVDEGEKITLIGANGAGKTTTLQSISGLLDSIGIRGEILYEGSPIQKKPAHVIAKKGLVQVLEGRHIFPRLSVSENLALGAYLRNDRKNVERELGVIFEQFPRLNERRNQMGNTLSGGEQQMLAIARALLGKPKIIMMDEPSLGLAPLIVKEIFEIINNICAKGITVILVEQNSHLALRTADRGYVMATGEIILHDRCDKLIDNEHVIKSYLGS
ncbi:MAG: ABC transporter ATP-binding protein [Synergistaceae bacterium]|jgi:branched-chain amino acid transport system ATP-binding protein|nr:ABC transporter ATP-binding protein [Synergistaceae bacterium]